MHVQAPNICMYIQTCLYLRVKSTYLYMYVCIQIYDHSIQPIALCGHVYASVPQEHMNMCVHAYIYKN